MASNMNNVLIFGPTGNVGRAAATEARARGARVWLAMRNTEKPIEGLEADSGYVRVQADLSEPSSLEDVVKRSGAKSAFVYTIEGSKDSMKESFQALERAGITYIVLLSSYGVKGPASDVSNQAMMISAWHAKTEMALEETGIARAVVRPAYYNTNIFAEVEGIKKGHVEIPAPNALFDYISPQDIGNVCGSLIVNKPPETPTIITLCGPDIIAQKDAYEIVSRVIQRPIEVTEIDSEAFIKKGSWPEPVARALLDIYGPQKDPDTAYPNEIYREAAAGIKRYTGKEPERFENWVKGNKSAFL